MSGVDERLRQLELSIAEMSARFEERQKTVFVRIGNIEQNLQKLMWLITAAFISGLVGYMFHNFG